jgi:hypothetical protein
VNDKIGLSSVTFVIASVFTHDSQAKVSHSRADVTEKCLNLNSYFMSNNVKTVG